MGDARRSASPLTVVVCRGSDCAKDQCDAYRSLVRRLENAGVEIAMSPCLGVCHGPVAVVVDEHRRAVVVNKVRSKKRQQRLVVAAADGCLAAAADAAPAVAAAKRRNKALRRAGGVLSGRLRSSHRSS
ncbi:MAG: hypothetical protein AAGA42_17195 [Actinomycetota bacterium]